MCGVRQSWMHDYNRHSKRRPPACTTNTCLCSAQLHHTCAAWHPPATSACVRKPSSTSSATSTSVSPSGCTTSLQIEQAEEGKQAGSDAGR